MHKQNNVTNKQVVVKLDIVKKIFFTYFALLAYLTVCQAVKSHTHTHIHTVDVSSALSCTLCSTVHSLLPSPCILHSELELTSITVNPNSHPPTPTRHDHERANHTSNRQNQDKSGYSHEGPWPGPLLLVDQSHCTSGSALAAWCSPDTGLPHRMSVKLLSHTATQPATLTAVSNLCSLSFYLLFYTAHSWSLSFVFTYNIHTSYHNIDILCKSRGIVLYFAYFFLFTINSLTEQKNVKSNSKTTKINKNKTFTIELVP